MHVADVAIFRLAMNEYAFDEEDRHIGIKRFLLFLELEVDAGRYFVIRQFNVVQLVPVISSSFTPRAHVRRRYQ